MSTIITPAVLYAAKSTEDKRGSIPTQLEDCREIAEREGWNIADEFQDEAASAYSGNRGPGLAAADGARGARWLHPSSSSSTRTG